MGRAGGLRAAVGVGALVLVVGLAVLGLTRPDLVGHGAADHGFHGGPLEGPSPQAARADPAVLLAHVLGRVYAAFGLREEGAVYDALAGVAAGDVLEALYLERRAVLTAAPEGGGTQELHGIEVVRAEAEERGGVFRIDGAWDTVGSVGHEDHVHTRGNRYAARLTVALRPEGWRLTAFELVETVRLEGVE